MSKSVRSKKKRGLLASLGRFVAAIVLAGSALLGVLWHLARPAVPDGFYTSRHETVPPPGTLIGGEPFTRDVPEGARAWRVLYATTRGDETPAVASAIVMAATGASAAGRPVVLWAHGTTGIEPGCAPSLLKHPFDNVPALGALLKQGWVYVATDYVGLGTSGGHAYLIGEDAARAVLDSARAVRQMPGLNADGKIVVWGHSQGGNSALWAGIRAMGYAPDVNVAGVAALAPATDLRALFAAVRRTMFGKIVSAYLAEAYAKAYPDVRSGGYLGAVSTVLARDMAGRCVGGRATLFSIAEASLLPGGIFRRDPASGPLGARLDENMPNAQINAPVLIAQGAEDDLVPARIQRAYVAQRCSAGQKIDYRQFDGRDHLSLVAGGSPLEAALIAWTRDRFNGAPATPNCAR
ncbi:alpha/beta fold hydrolase [Mesorhizobium sp. M2D.F.Ca.ET.185.01.1.1]|uniref:alpha/beta fold hydrolase n=3 Tax=Mesorhizobium TaxID=68287 RepID=UPI000FCC0CC7|nr:MULTISPECIES: alpha/beta fold hydrolase [unclassified Mesorhizobium]TGP74847.1 alpha/beta fold hydrolase [bacterium M00.F.Ca.ET.227.01.1.1]TGP84743.1 alpha/beta fold hydrolase [bacterium M00.F.Ca.ET.221.01.1.1]TGP87799.1 alpha/beta fold hydrolase [bacterium M00.F.Ca.ET.222.01.1.1]TGT97530.1 alpha/beta fold hydrolase [bacterium M00.F.Ca.ET.163.01.1.1]TGU21848.1 alpha/beta fold hydrolase [bacterium M00.F.Ca.ET.156.01.1.1]TGU42509.1 alpha/beta fold hydrolase [bacterium M00.F.Ca.ET.146.01.1.1]